MKLRLEGSISQNYSFNCNLSDRIKTEHEFEIKNLTTTIESKDRRIAQLERENKEMEQKITQRINSFHEQLQTQQDSFAKSLIKIDPHLLNNNINSETSLGSENRRE